VAPGILALIDSDYTRSVLRCLSLAVFVTCFVSAQSDVTRQPADYPSHAAWPKFDIGAEYMVHSIPTPTGAVFARDYLVIEVAIYPRNKLLPVKIDPQQFTLHINDNKYIILPESPGAVAQSIKYPSFQNHSHTEAEVGPVIIGRPVDQPHFPDDKTGTGRLPPRQPDPDSSVPQASEKTTDELVNEAALPEMETHAPVKGSLYFFYDKKLKNLKTLDLVYDDHGTKSYLSIK